MMELHKCARQVSLGVRPEHARAIVLFAHVHIRKRWRQTFLLAVLHCQNAIGSGQTFAQTLTLARARSIRVRTVRHRRRHRVVAVRSCAGCMSCVPFNPLNRPHRGERQRDGEEEALAPCTYLVMLQKLLLLMMQLVLPQNQRHPSNYMLIRVLIQCSASATAAHRSAAAAHRRMVMHHHVAMSTVANAAAAAQRW